MLEKNDNQANNSVAQVWLLSKGYVYR